jgi:trk system potassium uptake protein
LLCRIHAVLSRIELWINAGVLLALGVAMLVPLALSLIYQDGSWPSLLIPAVTMIAVGGFGFGFLLPDTRSESYVTPRNILLSVTLAWVLASLIGGTPYLIEGTFTSPIDSTFEAMSGFTTTGATLLPEIEAESPSILFWRSMTQWLGGIGIVVLFVAVAPYFGMHAARILSAEVSGISQPRFTPRIVDTAKGLLVVYMTLSVAETIALLLAGTSLYDAVIHTFTTIATGGFSPYTDSIGFYDSVAIEVIVMIFMALSAVSFALYYVLYSRREIGVLLDRELLAYLAILASSVLFVWGVLAFGGEYGENWAEALRYAAFDVISIMTTTGYITADFDEWDTAAKLVLFLLMFVGGCAGSTAGGVKVIRVLVVARTIVQDTYRGIHPQAVLPLKLGRKVIAEAVRKAILGLVLAWFAVFAVASILISVQADLSLVSSLSAVAATLNVIGPGLDQVGVSENYAAVNAFGRVVLTSCMLLGRLEIFTALALLSPAFWRR